MPLGSPEIRLGGFLVVVVDVVENAKMLNVLVVESIKIKHVVVVENYEDRKGRYWKLLNMKRL